MTSMGRHIFAVCLGVSSLTACASQGESGELTDPSGGIGGKADGYNCGGSCNKLKDVDQFDIDVKNPTGITFDEDHHLWVVSEDGDLFRIDEHDGKIKEKISTGRGNIQGVAWDKKNELFILADQTSNELVWFDPKKEKVELEVALKGIGGAGAEITGVAWHGNTTDLYVTLAGGGTGDFKHPAYCFIDGGEGDLDEVGSNCDYDTLAFLNDASDFAFGDRGQEFVLSRSQRELVELDDDDFDLPDEEYKLSSIKDPSGVVARGSRVYVVSESDSEVVVYEWR